MEVLQVNNISKQYGEKGNTVEALKNVSFRVGQGEFIAVVGTSGSGKSTLLNLIGGLDTPTQGDIIVRKRNIAGLKRKELAVFRRRNIGFVFQNYSLMPVLNVYDNVALPVTFDKGKYIDHPYLEDLLKELGLWEKRKRFPSELSGGQQQRVALARALANKPAILLANEEGELTQAAILLVAAFFGAFVLYSLFQVSVIRRMSQYSMMQTLGMTAKV